MPTPPTLTFTAANGDVVDLNGAAYLYLDFSDGWAVPPAEVDIIGRTQAGGVSIPYAAVGEREFELRVLVRGDTAEQSQARYHALIADLYITQGANEPRFGVLTFDGYGAASAPRSIRCAAKEIRRVWRGLNVEAQVLFTSESGIWYAPSRVALPLLTVGVGDDLPVLGVNAAHPGDALPWSFGSGRPHVAHTFSYAGSAVTRSLEARVSGPAEQPLFRRGDVVLRFRDTVPAGTTLLARMAAGARHQLLGSGDEVLGEFTATGDSFQLPLVPGSNTLYYAQANEIDGAYNTVAYSYRNEYLSAAV